MREHKDSITRKIRIGKESDLCFPRFYLVDTLSIYCPTDPFENPGASRLRIPCERNKRGAHTDGARCIYMRSTVHLYRTRGSYIYEVTS